MRILLLTLMLTGCSAYYPRPEVQNGFLHYSVVADPAAVDAMCDPRDEKPRRILACASPTRLIVSAEDWEYYIKHEMAHVFGVLTHD